MRKSFTIDGLGTIYQPEFAVYGDKRRELKKELSLVKSTLRYYGHKNQASEDLFDIFGGRPQKRFNEDQERQWLNEMHGKIKEIEERLQEPFNNDTEWFKLKLQFIGKKFEKINRLIEQGKPIPDCLSGTFVTFPLIDDPYKTLE